mmetsp:Transcript_87701/g.226005  ORF Transcript_87701/g.226005 Transcript_87701/m.226005 type:complete len:485 (+) Transcript_87701:589-2043(+)
MSWLSGISTPVSLVGGGLEAAGGFVGGGLEEGGGAFFLGAGASCAFRASRSNAPCADQSCSSDSSSSNGLLSTLHSSAAPRRPSASASASERARVRTLRHARGYETGPSDILARIPGNVIGETGRDDGLQNYASLTDVPFRRWIPVGIVLLVWVTIELLTLRTRMPSLAAQVASFSTSVALALAFLVYVFWTTNADDAFSWAFGYALEWVMSFDNMFVFHMIFESYQVPHDQILKALVVGVAGAIATRFLIFFTLADVMYAVEWTCVPFGLLLIWSGIEAVRSEGGEVDIKNSYLVRTLRVCMGSRLYLGYDMKDQGLFVRDERGRLCATMLLVVVVCLVATDLLFAFDSVSSKVEQIPNEYLAFTSTILAMFSLRSLYFFIAELVDMFALVKYGICGISLLIGIELVMDPWFRFPQMTSVIGVLSMFLGSVVASVVFTRRNGEVTLRYGERPTEALEDVPYMQRHLTGKLSVRGAPGAFGSVI